MLLLFHSCLFRCFCVVALAAFHRCSLSLLPVSFSHKSLPASHLYFIMSWWTKMASTLRCLMETRSLNSLKSAHTHTRMHRVWWESILGGNSWSTYFWCRTKHFIGPKISGGGAEYQLPYLKLSRRIPLSSFSKRDVCGPLSNDDWL